MSAVDDPGHGAVNAELGGVKLTLRLRLAEIERWEDKHPRGFYSLFYSIVEAGPDYPAPKVKEVRDLLALAIVGGGKTDDEAAEVMRREGADTFIRHRVLAQELLMVTLIPAKEDRDLLAAGGDDGKKNTDGSASDN